MNEGRDVKDWFTVERIDEMTYAISEYNHWEQVHSFLLIGSKKAALIDTGLGIENIREVVAKLTEKEIIVLTTHVHTDHIGGHGLFSDIRVHEMDADWLRNGIIGRALCDIRNELIRDVNKPDLPIEFDVNNYYPFLGEPKEIFKDKDLIDIGSRSIEVIHTPGHSPGHCCFLDVSNRYLFTGDLLYTTMPVSAFYPSTSPKDLLDSWDRISLLTSINRLMPSHYSLSLNPVMLKELKSATKYLRDNKLDRFGSGTHYFNNFSVKF